MISNSDVPVARGSTEIGCVSSIRFLLMSFGLKPLNLGRASSHGLYVGVLSMLDLYHTLADRPIGMAVRKQVDSEQVEICRKGELIFVILASDTSLTFIR